MTAVNSKDNPLRSTNPARDAASELWLPPGTVTAFAIQAASVAAEREKEREESMTENVAPVLLVRPQEAAAMLAIAARMLWTLTNGFAGQPLIPGPSPPEYRGRREHESRWRGAPGRLAIDPCVTGGEPDGRWKLRLGGSLALRRDPRLRFGLVWWASSWPVRGECEFAGQPLIPGPSPPEYRGEGSTNISVARAAPTRRPGVPGKREHESLGRERPWATSPCRATLAHASGWYATPRCSAGRCVGGKRGLGGSLALPGDPRHAGRPSLTLRASVAGGRSD